MTRTFNCPNCAAPLDYDGGPDLTITCPHCKSSVIVPAELRAELPSAFSLTNLPDIVGQSQNLAEMAHLVRAGKKIEAIKMYRRIFGGGLKDAKDAIDALAQGKPIQLLTVTTSAPTTIDLRTPANKRKINWLIVALIVFFFGPMILSFVFAPCALLFSFLPAESNVPVRTSLATATPTPGFASVGFKFGNSGTGPGYFNDARSIAVDGAGNIYVGEYQGGRIQAFDAGGKFITQWNIGEKSILRGMAADRKGIVYVVSGGEIQRYEGATGKPLDKLAFAGGNGFDDVVVTADGGLVTAWQSNRDDIVRFDSTGKASTTITRAISSVSGRSELNARVAADGLGNIFALGTFNRAVFKFSPEGKFLNRFGGEGNEPGQFGSVLAIAVDNQSRVYVSDSSKGIQVFDKDGRYLNVINVDAPVFGMVFNDKNELFVVARTQVYKYGLNQR